MYHLPIATKEDKPTQVAKAIARFKQYAGKRKKLWR